MLQSGVKPFFLIRRRGCYTPHGGCLSRQRTSTGLRFAACKLAQKFSLLQNSSHRQTFRLRSFVSSHYWNLSARTSWISGGRRTTGLKRVSCRLSFPTAIQRQCNCRNLLKSTSFICLEARFFNATNAESWDKVVATTTHRTLEPSICLLCIYLKLGDSGRRYLAVHFQRVKSKFRRSSSLSVAYFAGEVNGILDRSLSLSRLLNNHN